MELDVRKWLHIVAEYEAICGIIILPSVNKTNNRFIFCNNLTPISIDCRVPRSDENN